MSTTEDHRSTLTVYVLWHPQFRPGEELAKAVYSHLSRDSDLPTSRGLGIPVRFRSLPLTSGALPAPVNLDGAHRSVVVVLVDDEMIADQHLPGYVRNIWEAADRPGSPHRVLPVAMSANSFHLDPTIAEVNYIRLVGLDQELQREAFLSRLAHELCRLLRGWPRVEERQSDEQAKPRPGRPVTVFLSHAKADGLELAERFQDYIHRRHQLNTFFDVHDIRHGDRFEEVLRENVRSSAFLAFVTDQYAAREWCRYEALAAKRYEVPMLVVNAVKLGEQRSFPYLGNVPSVRWPLPAPLSDDLAYEIVLGLLLKEVLRQAYFLEHVENLRRLYGIPTDLRVTARPPELLTAVQWQQEHRRPVYLYPNPPLGTQEVRLLRQFDPELNLITPTMLAALSRR
jgi:hypothetical protein